MFSEIKSLLSNDSVFYSLIIIIVGITAFGLGRLSVAPESPVIGQNTPETSAPGTVLGVAVNPPEAEVQTGPAAAATGPEDNPGTAVPTTLVASKSGTKYHLATCPGAKQIKEENKIYFATEALARAAGYTPAANCPGLQ